MDPDLQGLSPESDRQTAVSESDVDAQKRIRRKVMLESLLPIWFAHFPAGNFVLISHILSRPGLKMSTSL